MGVLPARRRHSPHDFARSLRVSSRARYGGASPFVVPAIAAALALGAGGFALFHNYSVVPSTGRADLPIAQAPHPTADPDIGRDVSHEHIDQVREALNAAAAQARSDASALTSMSSPPLPGNAPVALPQFAAKAMTAPLRVTLGTPTSPSQAQAQSSTDTFAGSAEGGGRGAPAPGPVMVPEEVSFGSGSASASRAIAAFYPETSEQAEIYPQSSSGKPGRYSFIETSRDNALEGQVQPWAAQLYSVGIPLGKSYALIHVLNVNSEGLAVPPQMTEETALEIERAQFGCTTIPATSGLAKYQDYAARPPGGSGKTFELWYYGPFTGSPSDGPSSSARAQQAIATFHQMVPCTDCNKGNP